MGCQMSNQKKKNCSNLNKRIEQKEIKGKIQTYSPQEKYLDQGDIQDLSLGLREQRLSQIRKVLLQNGCKTSNSINKCFSKSLDIQNVQ